MTAEHTRTLRRKARACGVLRDQVDDVVQDVWLRFLQWHSNLADADPHEVAAWLLRVLRNIITDRYRASAHDAESLEAAADAGHEPTDPGPGPVEILERWLDREAVRAALDELRGRVSAVNVRVVELRFLEGATLEQVAALLGLSVPSVSQRQRRMLAKLRRILQRRKD